MKKTVDKKKIERSKFEGQLNSICRASPVVDAQRAQLSGSIKVANKTALKKLNLKVSRTEMMAFEAIAPDGDMLTEPRKIKSVKRKRDQVKNELEIDAFAFLSSDQAVFKDPTLTGRRGRVVTLRGTPDALRKAAANPNLQHVQMARTVKSPEPQNEGIADGAGTPGVDIHALIEDGLAHGGKKTLVGIIDVGGFDFSHEDFIVKTNADGQHDKTRFVGIWDQGGDMFAPPKFKGKAGLKSRNYGSFLTSEHLDFAMKKASETNLPPTQIVAQSQMSPGSHATHVASIAAGNNSISHEAMIAGVLISLPPKDTDSRLSFYDTTRIVHAVEFLFDLADELRAAGKEVDGVAINISLGTNGGPHDNSAPMSRWIDYALTEPGRCVCVAAGNAGQEAPRNGRDIGHIMGRIHTSGQLEATGLNKKLEWVVVGNGISDISENELEIWYQPQDRISVQLKPPGQDWLPVIEPGSSMQNIEIGNGTFVSIYSELYNPGNGHNRIAIYLTPTMTRDTIIGVAPGTWEVRLIGAEIRDGRYNCWIERDDPRHAGDFEGESYWQFPSFFAESTFVDDSSISTLACGDRIVAVANLDDETQTVNVSSSQGPTRDGRFKPDISAPGTRIWAANGFDDNAQWISKTGTSMASPYVAGVAASMITLNPSLTAAQILGIIRRTASPLPGRAYQWQNDAGFGGIDINACLKEAIASNDYFDIEPGDVS